MRANLPAAEIEHENELRREWRMQTKDAHFPLHCGEVSTCTNAMQ